MDNRKEQERAELHRAIWAIADDLRGAVDGWDFKSYVLGAMFYRYISENFTAYINAGEIEAGNTSFDYAKMSDAEAEEARAGLIEEKGFFIRPSELFCNVRAKAASDENLNETLERVFANIEDSAKGSEAEDNFAGLFDDFDVNRLFADSYGVYLPEGQASEITLRTSLKEAAYLCDLPLHPSQRLVSKSDRDAVISLRVCPDDSLIMDLVRLGSRIEVLSPPEIRERVIDEIKKMNGIYKI